MANENSLLLLEVQNELVSRAWVKAEDVAAVILERLETSITNKEDPGLTSEEINTHLTAMIDETEWREAKPESIAIMEKANLLFDADAKKDLEALKPLIKSKAAKFSDDLRQKLKKWGYI